MPFSHLGLSDKVLSAVASAGYTTPTPIQEQAIPHVLARRDVLGIAQTGTGKTAAFVLPMLTALEHGRARARMPRTLILEPTRELAAQVEDHFAKYGVNHKLNVALLIGGMSFDNQDTKLSRGVDVLVATPGRLLDHFERGRLLLSGVELLVIDEADRIVDTFLHNPVKVEVTRPATTVATTAQWLAPSGRDAADKRETLRRLIRAEGFKNAIVFCNRKREVAVLHRSLLRHGFSAVALHGDLDQPSRMAALDRFRRGETPLLIASDVAARGLDIPDVSHVFNFDVPHHPDDYVHRIGRTGRAGKSGTAITITAPSDHKAVAAIEKLIGQKIASMAGPVRGAEAEPPRAEPVRAFEKPRAARAEARAAPAPRHRRPHAPAKVTRLDEARPPRPQHRAETDGGHLPAFLLRPIRAKA